MRFFDSCAGRVTLAEVAEDIANDLAFEKYLKKLHENKEREKPTTKIRRKTPMTKSLVIAENLPLEFPSQPSLG